MRGDGILTIIEVRVELKKGVADPEGQNTLKTLGLLGFNAKNLESIKVFRITLDSDDKGAAEKAGAEMAEKLLANPVIQKYSVNIIE